MGQRLLNPGHTLPLGAISARPLCDDRSLRGERSSFCVGCPCGVRHERGGWGELKAQSSKFGKAVGRGGKVAEWQSGRLGVVVRAAAARCGVSEEERAVVLGPRLRPESPAQEFQNRRKGSLRADCSDLRSRRGSRSRLIAERSELKSQKGRSRRRRSERSDLKVQSSDGGVQRLRVRLRLLLPLRLLRRLGLLLLRLRLVRFRVRRRILPAGRSPRGLWGVGRGVSRGGRRECGRLMPGGG